MLIQLTTGFGSTPNTFHYVPTQSPPHVIFVPNILYHVSLKTPTKNLHTTATLQRVRTINDRHAEVLVLLHNPDTFGVDQQSLVLFPHPTIDPTFVRSSGAYTVLLATPMWNMELVSRMLFRRRLLVQTRRRRTARARPVLDAVNIRAYVQTRPMHRQSPTSWLVDTASNMPVITMHSTYNLWDAADDAFVLSANVVGIRAVERHWVEVVGVVKCARRDTAHSAFTILTLPIQSLRITPQFRITHGFERIRLTDLLPATL